MDNKNRALNKEMEKIERNSPERAKQRKNS